MKKSKNQEGIALVAVLVVTLLLLALGSAAMMMSELGYSSLSSETKYQYADQAADTAINKAIAEKIIPYAQCTGTGTGSIGNASYSYFGTTDENQTYCFVHATGTFGNAKVVKTAIIPRAGSDWAALRTLGGTINLSGSSAIAGCDDDESNYADRCGVVSAVIYSNNLNYSTSAGNSLLQCANEGTLKGFAGNPPLQEVSNPTMDELIQKYFNAQSFSDLMSKIEQQKGLEFYPDLPTTATVHPTGNPSCDYEGNDSCQTTSSTKISCGTGSNKKDIDLNTCSEVYIKSSLTISNSIDKNVTINSASTVNINNYITNVTIVSLGDINFSTSSNFTIQNSKLLSSGTIYAGTTGNNRFRGTIEDTDLFANALKFNLSTNSEIRGGIFYSKGNSVSDSVYIDTQGSLNFGTVSKPVLLLSEGTSSISMPGNFTFNGFIFTKATTISITGAVELQGMLVDASNNTTINNTGNATIQFNKQVLDNLYKNLKTSFGGSPLLNKPQCGAGNKRDYISNTKVTVY